MGRLMKKIQCQLMAWVSAPPASRPSDPPPAMTKVKTLMAWARSCGRGKAVTRMAMMTPADIAPPMPCSARAAISVIASGASPSSPEAKVKTITPARKTFLRPIRSPARPASSSRLP